jgi:hypothetical protein
MERGEAGVDPFGAQVRRVAARQVEELDLEREKELDEREQELVLLTEAKKLMPHDLLMVMEARIAGTGPTALARQLGMRQAGVSWNWFKGQVYLAFCTRLVRDGVTYGKILSTTKHPELAKSYIKTWSTTYAHQELGARSTSQGRAYHRIKGDGSGLARILNRNCGELAEVARELANKNSSKMLTRFADELAARAEVVAARRAAGAATKTRHNRARRRGRERNG